LFSVKAKKILELFYYIIKKRLSVSVYGKGDKNKSCLRLNYFLLGCKNAKTTFKAPKAMA
jgi:hypothetical protein